MLYPAELRGRVKPSGRRSPDLLHLTDMTLGAHPGLYAQAMAHLKPQAARPNMGRATLRASQARQYQPGACPLTHTNSLTRRNGPQPPA